ncbi:hypothetical protein AN189_03975 [Loktanella sp. 3ANDIMAR09]|uniref:MmcQ/YjbR family DNA-binding protein n=1 Tax=Loktanella sp. 3ANDIMAR09 TaxID=1225657 RepID=UPI0006F44912|nr:MmcQ/YjbR family DNA-binding protein [Loktanella sp. 3ANDIMAR09]KQI69567.1 hypothetical protein AN189_03975 [Loktanella sp. 3ANDIMAR09]
MSRDTVNALCATFANATCDDALGPGHDSWKIGGKLFASLGPDATSVSVKTDGIETAQMLIDAGLASRARYFHKSWVAVPLDADPAELAHRIGVSYDIIRASLTRAVRDSLSG